MAAGGAEEGGSGGGGRMAPTAGWRCSGRAVGGAGGGRCLRESGGAGRGRCVGFGFRRWLGAERCGRMPHPGWVPAVRGARGVRRVGAEPMAARQPAGRPRLSVRCGAPRHRRRAAAGAATLHRPTLTPRRACAAGRPSPRRRRAGGSSSKSVVASFFRLSKVKSPCPGHPRRGVSAGAPRRRGPRPAARLRLVGCMRRTCLPESGLCEQKCSRGESSDAKPHQRPA